MTGVLSLMHALRHTLGQHAHCLAAQHAFVTRCCAARDLPQRWRASAVTMNSHAIARIVVRATARERDMTRIKPAVHQRRSSVPRGDIKILPFTPHILDFCCSISRDSTDEILMLARVVVHQRAELWQCCTVIWSSRAAAPTRRDDARCCVPPNASRAAPFRHQPIDDDNNMHVADDGARATTDADANDIHFFMFMLMMART